MKRTWFREEFRKARDATQSKVQFQEQGILSEEKMGGAAVNGMNE